MKRVQSAFDKKPGAFTLGKSRSGLLRFRRSRSDVETETIRSDLAVAMTPASLAPNAKSPLSKPKRGGLHAALSFLRSKSSSKKQDTQDNSLGTVEMDIATATSDSSISGATVKKSNCQASTREKVALLRNGSYNVHIVREEKVESQVEVERDQGLEVSLADYVQTSTRASETKEAAMPSKNDVGNVPLRIAMAKAKYDEGAEENIEAPLGPKQFTAQEYKDCNDRTKETPLLATPSQSGNPSVIRLDHLFNQKSDCPSFSPPLNLCLASQMVEPKEEEVSPALSIQLLDSLACSNEYMETSKTYSRALYGSVPSIEKDQTQPVEQAKWSFEMFGQQVMEGAITFVECSTVGLCGPVDNPIADRDHAGMDELLETAAFELTSMLEGGKVAGEIEAAKPTPEIAVKPKQTSPSPQSMSSISFDSELVYDIYFDITSEQETARETPEETVQADAKMPVSLASCTNPFDEKSLVFSEQPFDEKSMVISDKSLPFEIPE